MSNHRFRDDVMERFARDPNWYVKDLSFQRWVFKKWLPTFFYPEQRAATLLKLALSFIFGIGLSCSPTARELVVAFQKESPWIFGTLIVGIALVAIPNALQHAMDERFRSRFEFDTVLSVVYYPVLVFCLSSIVGALWMVAGTSVVRDFAKNHPIWMGTLAAWLTIIVVHEAYAMLVNRAEVVLTSVIVDSAKDSSEPAKTENLED